MHHKFAAALAIVLSASIAFAAGQGKGKAHGPKTTRPAGAAHAPKVQKAPSGPKTVTSPKAHGSTARGTATRTASGAVARTPVASTTTTPTALPKNPKLVARLQALLPPGTDINVAAQNFRNQGAFVSAVHVSHNLDIEFSALKAKIVDEKMSLGQAIQSLRGTADASAEVRRAELQTADDLDEPSTKKPKRRP